MRKIAGQKLDYSFIASSVKYELYKMTLRTIGVLTFLILRYIQPVAKIKIGCLLYGRIGHLAENTEMYLRGRVIGRYGPGERHIFLSGEPANRQLLKMIKRRMTVIKNPHLLLMYRLVKSFIPRSEVWFDISTIDIFAPYVYKLISVPAQLGFTAEEEKRGQELLKSMGMEPGAPFVCFNARDNAYLNKTYPGDSPKAWSYHDFRNSDIRNFMPAARYLASRGIYMLRMGYLVERELGQDDPHIIDYANHYRSDFGDIYLSAKCKFFLAGPAGLISVPWILNTPVAYTNASSTVLEPSFGRNDIFICKKPWLRGENRFLSFPEALERGVDAWFRAELYEKAGIELIQNTPEEILALAKEMNARLDGEWVTGKEDEELRERYRKLFPPDHKYYGFTSRMGAEFLRWNKDWIFGKEKEHPVAI